MRISDWSSDVCSSDLAGLAGVIGSAGFTHHLHIFHRRASRGEQGNNLRLDIKGIKARRFAAMPTTRYLVTGKNDANCCPLAIGKVAPPNFEQACSRSATIRIAMRGDRKNVGSGKRVSVRVGLGGRSILKQHNEQNQIEY